MRLSVYEECCPECGHILSNDRACCSFCHWSTNVDQNNNHTIDFLIDDKYIHFIENQTIADELLNT